MYTSIQQNRIWMIFGSAEMLNESSEQGDSDIPTQL